MIFEEQGVYAVKGDGRTMIMEQLFRCYKSLDIKHAFFESIEEAKAWLISFD